MKKTKKILVVDDDQFFIYGVKALLKAAKYDVATASNPEE